MKGRPLKDWEIEKGIKIKPRKKSLRNKLYNKNGFKKLIRTNEIKIATNKGLEYLEEMNKKEDIND